MRTYIIILDKQIIGFAKAETKIMARHMAAQRLKAEGKEIKFPDIQVIEFVDNQVLIL